MLASTTMKNTCLLIYHLLDRLETDNIIRCITEKVKIGGSMVNVYNYTTENNYGLTFDIALGYTIPLKNSLNQLCFYNSSRIYIRDG